MTTQAEIRCIAFIGLGHMGQPMAARLVGGGFAVRVHDRVEDVLAAFVRSHGGTACGSVRDAVRGADVAIVMLPDDAAVRQVTLEEGGVLQSLAPGGIAIDMGTSTPSSTVAIAAAFSQCSRKYVDAPVMGGVPFARDGSLDIMCGGDDAALDACAAIFAALGRKTYRCGSTGSGHALKAIANFANAATFVTFLEAMSMGRKFGLDTMLMVEALGAMCTGRQHPLEKKIVPNVLTRRFATGMAMGLIAKDTGIAADLGHAMGARSSIVECVHAIWQEGATRYGFARDQAEIARLWEDDSDVRL